MFHIITRGKKSWRHRKDVLHRERKKVIAKLQDGIVSKNEMNRGEEGQPEFDAKVQRYDVWKKDQKKNMQRFGEINREFKKHGEEGRPHSLDDIRPDGKMKFE